MQKYLKHTFLPLVLLLVCSLAAGAQTITGGVTGIVTDASGAVVPNAKVTATNVDTGVQTATTSNNEGVYNLRFLQIGKYKVAVDAAGFATSTVGPFVLDTGQTVKFDAKLNLAGTESKVSVESELVPLINTESPVLSTTLDTRAIENMPLVSRNIVALTMFLPGAVSTNPNGFVSQMSISGPVSTQQSVSVNGNRQQTNQYLLDGMNINQTLDDTAGYSPSPDAIGQVQVISANAPAEYGNVLGGDILYQTKSGTNQFHGSAFFFLGNQRLNANTWANKHVTNGVAANFTPRAPFTRSQFGATFGGPVFHDKLFFFADYQGGRYHSGGVGTATVLTDAQRAGDFSELLDPKFMCSNDGGLSSYVIINGYHCASYGRLVQLYDATSAGSPGYVNNKITITNPAILYLLQHPEIYPRANHAPNPNSPASGNYSGPTKQRNYGDQFDVKLDYKLSDKDSVSGRFSWANQGASTQNVLPTSFAAAPTFPVRGLAINEVHTFNSSMVNEFRAGYTRIVSNAAVLLDPTGVFGTNGNKVLGIGANNPYAQAFAGFSGLSLQALATGSITAGLGTEYTNLGNINTGTNFTLNSFLYGDNFTWLKNRHTLKAGVQFFRQQQNNFYPGNDGSLGAYFFTGKGTTNPNGGTVPTNVQWVGTGTQPAQQYSTGYAAADLVMDRVSSKAIGGVSGPVGMRQWRNAFFVQDDWKVLPTLTVNLGVRYEYAQPIYEVNGKMSTVDPNNPSVIIIDRDNTSACAAAGVACVTAKSAGYGRGLVDPYHASFMPRLGFAWNAVPKFVVRGGYGLQNFMEGTGANLRMTTNYPFQSAFEANGTIATSTTPGNFFKVEDGMGSGTTLSNVFNVWNKHFKPEFISIYNLTLEYQVTNTASVQVGYVGESGQHLVTANWRNQLRNTCVINGVIQNPATIKNASNSPCLTQAPAPFAKTPGIDYNGNVRYTDSNAMMNYNAMQASFRQRAWHGLQYTANYTWSHAFTNSTGFYGVPSITAASAYWQNVYDGSTEYGSTGQDVRNAINWNLVYDLPLGRKRMFGGNMPAFLDEIVGGWKIGLTGIHYSGFPVNIAASNNTRTNGNSERSNNYRPLKIVNRTIDQWWGNDASATPCGTVKDSFGNQVVNSTVPNIANCAFGQPADGAFGTTRPSALRGPGYQNYGASVTKDFTIWHEHQINFRADADNVTNHASWGNPSSNVSTPSTWGQITSVRSGPRQLQLSVKYHF
ncbi:MAG: TonB-dependent receptor [Acidobacteria bacterium]|nr:TonB-dependent receptor [Acidobacteriota bacterium]